MQKKFLISLLILCLFHTTVYAQLPASMVGNWVGSPDYSVLGPWGTYPFNFSISTVNNNDSLWVMQDKFSSGGIFIRNSGQQFWVEEGVGLTYCGLIFQFFEVPGPIVVNFTQFSVDTKNEIVIWCKDNCAYQWTIEMLDNNTMQMQVYIEEPVVHLNVIFKRANTERNNVQLDFHDQPYFPSYCNVTYLSSGAGVYYDDSEKKSSEEIDAPKRCPFSHFHSPKHAESKSIEEVAIEIAYDVVREEQRLEGKEPSASGYQFCYYLSPILNVTLAWNFNTASQTLDVKLSMPLNASSVANPEEVKSLADQPIWLAIGFQPSFPAMQYADIALGYMIDSNTEFCVRSMFVPEYVGTPVDDSSLVLSNQNVVIEDGVISVSFTRAFDTGHHNITTNHSGNVVGWTIMWASGPAPSDCSTSPSYHSNVRGVRAIDWSKPSNIFPDYMMC